MDPFELELRFSRLDDERFVEQLYRLVLRRDPDGDGRASALTRLHRGRVSRARLLEEMVSSAEFLRVRVLDDAITAARADRAGKQRPRDLSAPAGIDERAIEIRWTLSRYRGERYVLDFGSANAEPAYLAALLALGARSVTGVDIASAEIPGLELVQGDLRALPFAEGSADLAFCISTLEHVGADNSRYGTGEGADMGGGSAEALTELRRVLRRGGRLLFTVPCGAHKEHGWFVQLEPAEWLDLFKRSGFFVREHELYLHAAEGWRSASSEEVGALSYGESGKGAAAVLCVELRAGDGPSLRERLHALRTRIDRAASFREGKPDDR